MIEWRKSTRSTNTNSCVEVAQGLVAVRDSKNAGGPVLRFREGRAVVELLAAVRHDRFGG